MRPPQLPLLRKLYPSGGTAQEQKAGLTPNQLAPHPCLICLLQGEGHRLGGQSRSTWILFLFLVSVPWAH